MVKNVFVIKDVKACAFKRPFIADSRAEAIRAFADIALDERTEIGRHGEDFCLYEIATFDADTGKFENIGHISHGLASDFKAKKMEVK